MNHLIYSADRRTHLKIVAIGLVCACFVLIVGAFADQRYRSNDSWPPPILHVGHLDLGTAPLVKAGGANLITGQPPVIR
jgi:hypothetical protein